MLSFGSLHTNIATGKNSLSKAFGRQGHETGLRFDSSYPTPEKHPDLSIFGVRAPRKVKRNGMEKINLIYVA